MCNICGNKAHDQLDDSIDDLFGGIGQSHSDTDVMEQGMLREESVEFARMALANARSEGSAKIATFEEDCPKCKGRGTFIGYSGRVVGNCFHCKGKGKVMFKTSAETRAKAAEAKGARHAAKILEWLASHPEETEWLKAASARGFRFASDMLATIGKYGDLNEFKLGKVREFMVKDQLRAEEKAEIEARAPQINGAPLAKIENAFETALANMIRFPKLRLDEFIFSPVQSGPAAGAIYVKHASEVGPDSKKRYLGKIVDGRFVRRHPTTAAEEERIVAAAMDPEAAAKAYGQRMGRCSICGIKLTRNESIDRAMGPICSSKYGWG